MRWRDIVDEVEHQAGVAGADLEGLEIPEIVGVRRMDEPPFVQVELANYSDIDALDFGDAA